MITARIDAVNEFLDGAGVSVGTVTLPRNPDPRVERYSGNPALPFTAKTTAEIAAYDAAQSAAGHNLRFVRDLQALAGALFKAQTGSFPNAAQKAQLKADFVTAWKALG